MKRRIIFLVGTVGVLVMLSVHFLNEKEKVAEVPKNGIDLYEYGVVGDGVKDDTVNFQAAINDAVKRNQALIIPVGTYLVSPLKYRDPSSSDWWCLSIPSNATLYFEAGAILKLVDDAPSWTRVLVIDGVSNVSIYGHVEVDGSANTITSGNEHMHGIFIFHAENVFIESANSHDSYGDNLFIGGTEDEYSNNVVIDSFNGMTAGRKNLVIHYVDNLHMKTVILDNSKGGSGNNWRGENSLDLEPDDFEGNKEFYQRIDYITTYGMGNDFTVGTEGELAKKWVLDIGQFQVKLMEGAVEGILSYAVTVRIDKLFLQSTPDNQDVGMNLMYAAYWEINEATFIDGGDYALVASEEHGQKPMIKMGKVLISRPNGKGFQLWGADTTIEYLEANTTKGRVLEILSTMKQLVRIENLIIRNSGESESIFVTDYYEKEMTVEIEKLFIVDDRENKIDSIVYLATKEAVNGFKIRKIQNNNCLNEITYGRSIQ